jgi:hypothetical protein
MMPTPISTTRTGTGWTVDVTSLVLSTNLGYKDFLVKINGVVSPLSNFTKTNPALITYGGVAVASNSPVVVYRDSNRLVDDAAFGDVNTSSGLNTKFTQVELVLEDIRQMITLPL